MAELGIVRVAAVQSMPMVLDLEATIDKVIELLGAAADQGATLVVFPECFVSLYPSGAWAGQATEWSPASDELWERMWSSSVVSGLPGAAVFSHKASCVISTDSGLISTPYKFLPKMPRISAS